MVFYCQLQESMPSWSVNPSGWTFVPGEFFTLWAHSIATPREARVLPPLDRRAKVGGTGDCDIRYQEESWSYYRARASLGRPFKVALGQKETLGRIGLLSDLFLCFDFPSALAVCFWSHTLFTLSAATPLSTPRVRSCTTLVIKIIIFGRDPATSWFSISWEGLRAWITKTLLG